jgi:hypothetical protein
MADWIVVGDSVLNVDNIEFVERYTLPNEVIPMLKIYMSSGKVIELTNAKAVGLWNYLDSERLKFLDLDNPTRDFSGT